MVTAVVKPSLAVSALVKSPFTAPAGAPVQLKNNITGVAESYVHNLLDVVEDHPVDGATLVYNANTNKYDVKPITVSVTSLDGGSF